MYIMKNLLKLGLLLAVIFVMGTEATAQKFGYLNSSALLAEMPEVKQAEANLEDLRIQLQKKQQEMFQGLQTKYQDLQRKEQQGEISPKQLQEQAALLQAEESQLMQEEQNMQNQLLTKRETLLQPILDRVNDAIASVAKENGYQFIFDASAGILYADESQDVTAMVKAKLNL